MDCTLDWNGMLLPSWCIAVFLAYEIKALDVGDRVRVLRMAQAIHGMHLYYSTATEFATDRSTTLRLTTVPSHTSVNTPNGFLQEFTILAAP